MSLKKSATLLLTSRMFPVTIVSDLYCPNFPRMRFSVSRLLRYAPIMPTHELTMFETQSKVSFDSLKSAMTSSYLDLKSSISVLLDYF
jgi:hypothetical protein